MRTVDRILQRWRISKAIPHIHDGDRLLDVGCFDGALLQRVRHKVAGSVGVDPQAEPRRVDNIEFIRDTFPGEHVFEAGSFDCITLLAVFEHLEDKRGLSRECFRLLRPGGRAVLTVPRPAVDSILDVLFFLRLADGISCEQHHRFDSRQTVPIFEQAGFRLEKKKSFQLGLNGLYVFAKP